MNRPENPRFLRRFIRSILGTLAALALPLAGCQPADEESASSPPSSDAPPSVYVVNYPLQYFVEQIAGDAVAVHFPAPPEVDPAHWTPSESTIRDYQQADRILLNGAGYAQWTQQATLPASRTVNTSATFQDRIIKIPDGMTHSHGPGEEVHSHGAMAFTTWLDPTLAIEHARVIRQTLSELLPDRQTELEERFDTLKNELEALDQGLAETVRQHPEQPLLASHPVYQYLERRYDLNLESLHWEPDEPPEPSEWEKLDATLDNHPAQWMLWEAAPLPEIVEKLDEREVEPIIYDPCSHKPPEGDFLDVMKANLASLRRAFESSNSE